MLAHRAVVWNEVAPAVLVRRRTAGLAASRTAMEVVVKKYRVFSQDVGKYGYSGVKDVMADSPRSAVNKVGQAWEGEKMIALPHGRKDLWPDGQTGRVPREALRYC